MTEYRDDHSYGFLEALTAIHECGFLHGDIRPENLLVDSNSKACIIDFHLSRRRKKGDSKLAWNEFLALHEILDNRGHRLPKPSAVLKHLKRATRMAAGSQELPAK
jgi:serine/threonine protein kinase